MLHLVPPPEERPLPRRPSPHPAAGSAPTVATVAELLTDGPLAECECRAIGARVAQAVAGGTVAGPVTLERLVFTPDGDLWLAAVDDPSPVAERDHVRAIAALVVELATGIRIDPVAAWPEPALRRLGCSDELAADVALVFATQPLPVRVAGLLQRRDDRLPRAPRRQPSIPEAIDLPSPAIAGLSPIGHAPAADDATGRGRRGWPRWATAGRARRRIGRAS